MYITIYTYIFTGLLGIYETVKKQVQIMFGGMRIIEILYVFLGHIFNFDIFTIK